MKAVTKDVTPSFPTFFSELEKFDKTLASFPEISSIAFIIIDMLLTDIVNDSGDGILLQNVLMDFANPDNFFPKLGRFLAASPKSAFANLDNAVMPFTDALTVATLSSPYEPRLSVNDLRFFPNDGSFFANLEMLLSPNILAAHPPSLGNLSAALAIFCIALAAHPTVET